ncbi:hypothetical protein [Haliea sp.]|uniref:hypothetical protein n=1 Tax=Haliea sp. TaxID=1932666 RepID=UPI0025C2E17B|nr:hypothetical protein [Haliea sp.]|tara:strand:+ start:826 stop:1329 length:504 start_codon:yes stop_codon:yes gene_type:complete
MPDLTPDTLQDVFSQYMPTTLLPLLRYKGFDNDGNVVNKYYVNNWQPITSNGQVYQAAAFKMSLGSDESDNMPDVTLTFDSGDRQVINELRIFNEAPDVYLSVVVAERPDVVELPEIEFRAKEWTVKDSAVTIQLESEPVLSEPIVGDIVTPNIFPLLWENVTVQGQ